MIFHRLVSKFKTTTQTSLSSIFRSSAAGIALLASLTATAQTPYGIATDGQSWLTKVNLNTMAISANINNPNGSVFVLMDAADNGSGLGYALDTTGVLHEVDLVNNTVLRSQIRVECLNGSINRCEKIAVSPDGQYIALHNRYDARVIVVDRSQFMSFQVAHDLMLGFNQLYTGGVLKFSPNNQYLYFSAGDHGDPMFPVTLYEFDMGTGGLSPMPAVQYAPLDWAKHPRSLSFFSVAGTYVVNLDALAKDPSLPGSTPQFLGINQVLAGVGSVNYYPYAQINSDHWYDISNDPNSGFVAVAQGQDMVGFDPLSTTFVTNRPSGSTTVLREIEFLAGRVWVGEGKFMYVYDRYGNPTKVTVNANYLDFMQPVPGSTNSMAFTSYFNNSGTWQSEVHTLTCSGLGCTAPISRQVLLPPVPIGRAIKQFKVVDL